jgi:hypothetical protein
MEVAGAQLLQVREKVVEEMSRLEKKRDLS